MAGNTLRFKIIEQFLADGMNKMFGNPGTVEQGFLDALLQYPEMKYILTLQESIAVLAGDAHARSTQKPTLVQIHSTPGLGNSIGALYQAYRGHSPLVVIGGDSGVKYLSMDSQMAGDLVGMAKPVTKWSTVIYDSRTALRTIRKAVKIASTPPMGPVYICLPMDVLDEICTEDVFPAFIPSTKVIPDDSAIESIVKNIAKAAKPIMYIGDGVAYSGAVEEVSILAHLIGAEVYNVDGGDLNINWKDPLFKGQTGHMFGYSSLPIFKSGDLNLIIGTYIAPEVFPELGDIFDSSAMNIHIDLNAYEIAKNHRVDIGVVADPKLTLQKIIEKINNENSNELFLKSQSRVLSITQENQIKQQNLIEADKSKLNSSPLHFEEFSLALSKHISEDTIIFDEALTNSPALTRYITPSKAGNFFQTRGGSLGVGIPGGLGLKVANPDKPVIVFTGDGGSMYSIQALWTAVRHNLDVKIVICNNSSYHLLQLNIDAYWNERTMDKHEYPLPFDLSNPPLNFKAIAESLGVRASRVEQSWQIEGAIKEMLSYNGPYLIDLVIESDVRPDKINSHCGQ
jgi:benzoylformate decarboxylase